MDVNKAGQNREEKANRQIIEKDEQRCVDDSGCCRGLDQVSQRASAISSATIPNAVLFAQGACVLVFGGQVRGQLRCVPASTESFDQQHGTRQSPAEDVDRGHLVCERGILGSNHLQVCCDATLITSNGGLQCALS